MTGFDYDRCLDKNGNFHTGKAKSYLKSIGLELTDAIIEHIKEFRDVPGEFGKTGAKKQKKQEENNEMVDEAPPVVSVQKSSLKDMVGFKEISPYGGRQCQFCRHFNRFGVVEEEAEGPDEDGESVINQMSVLIKTDNPKEFAFFCKKHPWPVAKVSTCRKFGRR